MIRFISRTLVLAVAVAACLFCFLVAQAKKPDKPGAGGAGATYTIIPFRPSDFASTQSYVTDLNDVGHAVGTAERPSGDDQAVHLDVGTGVYTSLKSDSVPCAADGVNNRNQIIGQLYFRGFTLAVFWSDLSAEAVPLLPLGGDWDSYALAINDDGIVVGVSLDENGQGMGAVWRVVVDADGTHVDGPVLLPPLDGHSGSWGRDVNATVEGTAQVAGTSDDSGLYEAVVWTVELNDDGKLRVPDAPRPLGTLGIREPSQSSADGINNAGAVCGSSDWWPFIAPADGEVEPLDIPRKSVGGFAADINDHGDAVGIQQIWSAQFRLGVDHAYLWKDGDVIDLNKRIPGDSGWGRLRWAYCINNAGVIGGWGAFDVNTRGFLLIPNQP